MKIKMYFLFSFCFIFQQTYSQKNDASISSLKSLKNGDSLMVNYTPFGDMKIQQTFRLVISRKNNEYIAKLYESTLLRIGENEEKKQTSKSLLKSAKMNDDKISYFYTFEKELSKMSKIYTETFCTTKLEYRFNSKFVDFTVFDSKCNWDGFNKLRCALF